MKKVITPLLALAALAACGDGKPKPLREEQKAALLALGDSIAAAAQNVLLQNVAGAIKAGGTEYAVGFCNINAIPLTDSVADHHKVSVQRLSDRNRNPRNAIQTQADSLAWEKIKTGKADFIEQDEHGSIYYYKPVMIGMPTCLKCHGGTNDIDAKTLSAIHQKYPGDKAINYIMGDLRGMWKINLTAD